MPSLLLATNNMHKVREIRAILKTARLKMSLKTVHAFPHLKPVVENRNTIEGNAIKKAKELAKRTEMWALADDTGLFIDALRGKPGVISARFAGPRCRYQDNNNKVLRLLKQKPWEKRRATFRCVAALATPKGKVLLAEGRISGRISTKPMGRTGFGYDPIFWVPAYKKTLAELGPTIKNKISHRSKAFSKVPNLLKRMRNAEG